MMRKRKVFRTHRFRSPFITRGFSYAYYPIFSHETMRSIMQDLQCFVFSGGGAYFSRAIRPPPKWKVALCVWAHNTLRKYYRRLDSIVRTRYWDCPACPRKEIGTRYWSSFPGGVSWCKDSHYWNNETGERLIPPDGLTYQISSLVISYMRQFGAFDWGKVVEKGDRPKDTCSNSQGT